MTLGVEVADRPPDDLTALGIPVVGADGDTVGGERALELLGDAAGVGGGVAGSLLPAQPDMAWLRRQGFTAKAGQSLVLRSAAGSPSVVLVGLGPAAGLDAERWRLAAAALVRSAGEAGAAALVVPEDPPGGTLDAVGSAIAEGAVLAAYRFDAYRSDPPPPGVERLVVVGVSSRSRDGGGRPGLSAGVRRGSAAAGAAVFARDLVNTPASDLTPARMAERVAGALAGHDRTTVEVWDEPRIAAERMGGLLAVSRGSGEPPRFVRADYQPSAGRSAEPVPHVVLVGKGITFDSGGLSLKTADGMVTMKTDMSGAAVVMAVVSACAELDVPVRVTALAPLTENMPDGRAVKPGDVLTARNGATVEVLNTDAEGRLVLADALSLAAELAPDAIVDVATLTGAARVALGSGVAAVMGNDDGLVEALRESGRRSGERSWRLPLPVDYREHIDSDVADMKNIGRPGEAGAIAAGMLLARFVGTVPWAHLDIAGTGRAAEPSGYLTKGGTAFGVRTLLDLVAHYHDRAAT